MINKSEIRKNYKRTLNPMGVYQVKNLVNGKIFIGSSKNIPARLNLQNNHDR
ncbi:MAG: GIY-YIG nuclease family protein [Ignavibacteriaceae bacterium]